MQAPLPPKPRTGAEPFRLGGQPAGFDLLGFWRWHGSDLLSNALRGCLAEYVVAQALGVELDGSCRLEWDAADLRLPGGRLVEVKSAAYRQSWNQARPSAIRFGIAPSRGWDALTNVQSDEERRQADVYVFALLGTPELADVDPLDLDRWTFRVLPTAVLDARLGAQKSLGLATLDKLGAVRVGFEGLRAAVAEALGR